MKYIRILNLGLLLLASPFVACQTATHNAGNVDISHRNFTQEDANLKFVLDWYEKVFNQRDIKAVETGLDENYIQHNPSLPTGRAALIAALPGYWARNPDSHFIILRSAAQDDLVFMHSKRTNGSVDNGKAYVDIFRVRNGKIVEHWDVSQPVPATSMNENTMF